MSVRIIGPRISLRNQAYQLYFRRNYTVKYLRTRLLPSNPFLGGLVGGFVGVGSIVLTGYTYYHYSGAKKVVDSVKPATALLGQSRENLTKEAQGHALQYLREAAKVYVATIPFAGLLVDKAFDAMGDLVLPHSEEATAIIWRAYDDISAIIQEKGNEHRTDGAWRIISVTRRLLKELTALGFKAGQPISDKLELERRAADARVRASTTYDAMKSGTLSMADKMKDKTKSLMASHSKSDSGSKVTPSETGSQESVQNLEETK